jgi:phosphotriesterase-related protein
MLLSHEAGGYHVGEPGGGQYRPHDTLVDKFVPAFKAAEITAAEVDRLTMHNPRAAFVVRARRAP